MCCAQLLMLENSVPYDTICDFQNYLASLNPNSARLITVSSVAMKIDVSYQVAGEILKKCLQNGILSLSFGLRCNKCGQLIKRVSEPIEEIKTTKLCYRCEREIQLTEDDVIALFELKILDIPFVRGRQERVVDGFLVAPEDAALNVFANELKTTCINEAKDKESLLKRLKDIYKEWIK